MIRHPMPEERDAVEAFFDAIEAGLATRVLGSRELAVVESGPSRYAVLTTRAVLALPEAVLEGCDAAGLAIGSLEGGAGGTGGETTFQMDLQGAVLAARHTLRNTVRVTEHAARLFLYGRNILGAGVTHADDRLERGDVCIVTNPRNEALGLGTVVGRLKGDGEAVRPIHDLGTYLRDQDEGDQ